MDILTILNITPINGRGQAEIIIKKKFLGRRIISSMCLKIPVRITHANGANETEIMLDGIALNTADVRTIRGRGFDFPVIPYPGYIDGSVYFANVHNPVDCDRITFLSEIGDHLSLKLHCVIDFTHEGAIELGKRDETFLVELAVVKSERMS